MMRRAQLRARRQAEGERSKTPLDARSAVPEGMSGPTRTITPMRVAVIDVGSNTARLLVANVTATGSVLPVAEEREYLRLGAEIERTGTLGRKKIAEAAATCCATSQTGPPRHGAERVAVFVTAPGRQGDGTGELTEALAEATSASGARAHGRGGGPARLRRRRSPAREGVLPEIVAVVDVGGGSTELAVGTPLLGAAWIRSADLGSLRLTRAHLHHDPPTAAEVGRRAARGGGGTRRHDARRRPTSRSRSAAAPERSRRSRAAASTPTSSSGP